MRARTGKNTVCDLAGGRLQRRYCNDCVNQNKKLLLMK